MILIVTLRATSFDIYQSNIKFLVPQSTCPFTSSRSRRFNQFLFGKWPQQLLKLGLYRLMTRSGQVLEQFYWDLRVLERELKHPV
ncbi:unnamed protein product, partial [Brenthis ino]